MPPSRRSSELLKQARRSPYYDGERQTGSHVLVKSKRKVPSGEPNYVVYPVHRSSDELPLGLWRAIIRAAERCGFLLAIAVPAAILIVAVIAGG